MAKWLRISNPGCFDVISAVNMLGASVKVNENPIGMFGSGTKFALAQSVRDGLGMKIYDGKRMFNVGTSKKDFRDKSFNMVTLTSVGKKVVTPITTDFGGKDWNDDWFIFREFYSNALDEKNASLTVVDSPEPTPDHTSIFLPYEKFRKFHDNLASYFTDKPNYSAWAGDGSMYKSGVFVGKIDGCKICYNYHDFAINESRVLDTYAAAGVIGNRLGTCKDVEVWKALFESSDTFKSTLYVSPYGMDTWNAVADALVAVYGSDYCICPKVDSIVRDAHAMGMTPVVLPENFNFNNPLIRVYLNMNNTKTIRSMNASEQTKYDNARLKISAFIPLDMKINVSVFADGIKEITGDANLLTGEIRIRDSVFNDELQLLQTLIHEIGHVITKAGDYDRKFTAFFVDKLAELAQ